MSIESFAIQPLQALIQSYVYQEYSDDADVQAFVGSFNGIAQGYVDWFNQTPLAVYTSGAISGPLLDWIGQGLYGISRPTISSLTTKAVGGMNSYPMNTRAMNSFKVYRSGTAQIADDDIYKRTLTWHTYKGDGIQMSLHWLRRRVARFIYGANGSDIDIGLIANIGISQPTISPIGALSTRTMNAQAMNSRKARTAKAKHAFVITVPNSLIGQQFEKLLSQGYLAIPFQINLTTQLSS